MDTEERRQFRRLDIKLPLECSPCGAEQDSALRTTTKNVSSGGIYFEFSLFEGLSAPKANSLMNIKLTVPPGDGYFPYVGCVKSVAEVVRCEELPQAGNGDSGLPLRVGVAAKFQEQLRLAFQ